MKSIFWMTMIAAVMGCHQHQDTTASAETETVEPQETMEKERHDPIIVKPGVTFPTGDNYTIKSAETSGDILHLVVQYGGGCQEHEFTLFSDGAMMKSMPPQMNVTLQHEGNGDTCRGWITDSLSFNLSPIKAGTEGTIILRLRNYDSKIVYNY